MKTIKYIIIHSLCLICLTLSAQNIEDNEAVRTYVDNYFENIDKTRIPTGYLKEYAFELIDFSTYDGLSLTDDNSVNSSTFEMMLRSIRSAAVGTKPFNDVSAVLDNLVTNNNNIPVAISLYKYNYIKPNALSNGLISVINDQAYDVFSSDGAWQNPYDDAYIFGFAPIAEISYNSTVTFVFNGLFTNSSINRIEFDPGNGGGYRNVATGNSVTVSYPRNGIFELKLRVTLSTGEVLLSHSSISIDEPLPETKADGVSNPESVSEVYNGTTVKAHYRIAYNKTTNSLRKPIIVVEGIDPLLTGIDVDGTSIFDVDSIPSLIKSDYDVVYVDWENSEEDIFANAALLKKIIIEINELKSLNGSSEKNIIIGQSLGGVIARIALCQMEESNILHETETYVSHDSPHLGATVPIGALYAFHDLYDLWYCKLSGLSVFSSQLSSINSSIKEVYDFAHSTAVKQLLVNYVNPNGELDNSYHENFISTLRTMGFPKGDPGCDIVNLAICHSGNGSLQYTSGQSLLHLNEKLVEGFLAYFIYLLTGQETYKLFRGIGSDVNIYGKIDIKPFISSGNKVAEIQLTYNKKILSKEKTFTILSSNYHAPSSIPYYDSVPASLYNLSNLPSDFSSFVNMVDLADKVAFIPTVSAINLKNGIGLSSFDYNRDYYSYPPDYQSETPFMSVKLENQPEMHVFDSSLVPETLNWVINMTENVVMDGPKAPKNGDQYSIRNCSYPVTWSTSDPSIATIDNTGKITIKSSGFVTIKAFATINNSRRYFVKRVMVGFPNFTLSSTKMTGIGGNTIYSINASTTSEEFSDFVDITGVRCHWGIKYSDESNAIWTETDYSAGPLSSGVGKTFSFNGHNNSSSALVSFYLTNSAGKSDTRTIGITNSSSSGGGLTPFPPGIIITSDGNIIDINTEEEIPVETKSTSCEHKEYKISIDTDDIVIDIYHYPTMSEILQKLVNDEKFTKIVKMMKPWGEKEILIKTLTLVDGDGCEVWSVPLSLIYQENL